MPDVKRPYSECLAGTVYRESWSGRLWGLRTFVGVELTMIIVQGIWWEELAVRIG
jgi:hypothetical protein